MNGASMDLGLFLIRVTVGITMCVHGINKCFGPGGITGTASWFESVGLRPGLLHARTAVVTELVSGLLVMSGLAVPLAAVMITGTMGVAASTDHRGKGFFVFKGGWEYVAVLALLAIALASTGPGGWSLERSLGWEFHGIFWGCTAGVVGALATIIASASARARERDNPHR
ncbi:DoxX family protein [Nocardia sp. NPDC004860]|uniref:DoxX family protein n=1 Tax=Nocardia sp. NPDC004860 TaxID=3154557 RepID=UPI0033B104C2